MQQYRALSETSDIRAGLTRDWDPVKYLFGHEPLERGRPILEDSPEELARYSRFIEVTSPEGGGSHLTRRSLVGSLWIAADNPVCTHGIVGKIFDEILRLLVAGTRSSSPISSADHNEDGDELFLFEFATALARGDNHLHGLERVRSGFAALCDSM